MKCLEWAQDSQGRARLLERDYPWVGTQKISCAQPPCDSANLVCGCTWTTEFPKLPEMQQVTYKVLRFEERDKRLVIKEAQMVS